MVRDSVRSAVVWRTGALGDFVLTLPILDALRARADHLVLIAPARYRAIWARADRWIDADGAHAAGLFAGAPLACDLGVAWTASAAAALRSAGVPQVLEGAPLPGPGVHQSDALWSPLAPWLGPRDRDPQLVPQAPWPGPPPLVIAPGSGGRSKRWPVARWREVAAGLDPVLWVGGPQEADEPGWGEPRRDDLGLAELVCLAAHCRGWLGPDAGPQHLAAAAGARVGVVFTGATDPACWAPIGATIFERPTSAAVRAWAQSAPG